MKTWKSYNKSRSSSVKKHKRKSRAKLYIYGFIVLCLLCGSIYVSRLPALQISNITVSGAINISEDDIKNAVLESISGNFALVIPKTNIFLVSKENIEGVLYKEFPRIKKVDTNKNADGLLAINIKERLPSFLWCREKDCYFLDNSGLIFSEADQGITNDSIVFRGLIKGDPILQYFGDEELLNRYKNIVENISKHSIKVNYIDLGPDKGTLNTSMGNIIFTTNDPNLDETIDNALALIENEKIKNVNIIFEYIDVRFGKKFFFKTY